MFGCLFLNPFSEKAENISMGKGKMIVEFFSADIELRVWNIKKCDHLRQKSMGSIKENKKEGETSFSEKNEVADLSWSQQNTARACIILVKEVM